MLGCDQSPVARLCTNPGGVDGDRTGTAPLPTGPPAARRRRHLGTKNGDAAMVEKMSEEGAVLLKNDGVALPITSADLDRRRAGRPARAPSTPSPTRPPRRRSASSTVTRSTRCSSCRPSAAMPDAFTFVPANSPSGETGAHLGAVDLEHRVTGDLTARRAGLAGDRLDGRLHHRLRPQGQLAPGSYTWTGYVYVPTTDTYTFRFQFSPSVAAVERRRSRLTARRQTLSNAGDVVGSGATSAHGAALPGTPDQRGRYRGRLTNEQSPPAR